MDTQIESARDGEVMRCPGTLGIFIFLFRMGKVARSLNKAEPTDLICPMEESDDNACNRSEGERFVSRV